ncbi:acetyl-CoA carboxylase carboxyl transferase subunit beta, partial [bacterium]|nr:acetyl-CoA carboxylase carboxyl transferase subunit beta [bacterium]
MSSWFKRDSGGIDKSKKREMPEGLWTKCEVCST